MFIKPRLGRKRLIVMLIKGFNPYEANEGLLLVVYGLAVVKLITCVVLYSELLGRTDGV